MLDRNELTDEFLAWYASAGLLVGDAIAPYEGGWTEGQQGVGSFVPYAVLGTGSATTGQRTLCADSYEYSVNYSMGIYGESRRKTDQFSHEIHLQLLGRTGHRFFGYKIVELKVASFGAISRNDSTSPASWSQQDSVVVHLTPA